MPRTNLDQQKALASGNEREGDSQWPCTGSTRSRSRHAHRAPTIQRAHVDEQIGVANERAVHETSSGELNVMIEMTLTLIIVETRVHCQQ